MGNKYCCNWFGRTMNLQVTPQPSTQTPDEKGAVCAARQLFTTRGAGAPELSRSHKFMGGTLATQNTRNSGYQGSTDPGARANSPAVVGNSPTMSSPSASFHTKPSFRSRYSATLGTRLHHTEATGYFARRLWNMDVSTRAILHLLKLLRSQC